MREVCQYPLSDAMIKSERFNIILRVIFSAVSMFSDVPTCQLYGTDVLIQPQLTVLSCGGPQLTVSSCVVSQLTMLSRGVPS